MFLFVCLFRSYYFKTLVIPLQLWSNLTPKPFMVFVCLLNLFLYQVRSTCFMKEERREERGERKGLHTRRN